MIEEEVCGELARSLGDLFQCSSQGRFKRIRTPFLYPDGDYIDLFCREEGGTLTVSDLGETTRWLRMQTTVPRRSARQQALIQDAIQTHNVEFFRGTLTARCKEGESVSDTVLRVAQAALRVSDLWFTFRTRTAPSLTEDVAEFLGENQIHFDRGEKLVGRSGRIWTVDFHVRQPEKSSLVNVLATGSKSAARGVVEHVLTVWYDLNNLTVGPEGLRFISLFDDTVDVWADEDFRLLGDISTITRWSRTDEVLDTLRRAA